MSSFILKAVGWLAENFLGSLVAKAAENAVQQFLTQPGDRDGLNNLQSSLRNAKIIVNTIENMRIKDESLKKRLEELVLHLKDAAYDADDLLDEFQYRFMQQQMVQQGYEASDIASSSSSSYADFPPSKKIKTTVLSSATGRLFRDDDDVIRVREIKGRIDRITTEIKEFTNFIDADVDGRKQILSFESRRTTSISGETEVFGRDKELSALIELLKSVDASEFCNQNVSILTIVGIGGVGKTTLAQQAYNDKRVDEHFQRKGWVSVSENFSVERLTKEIIESATGQRCDLISFDALQVGLKEKIASGRFLLVLDDVWDEDKHKWESLCSPLRFGVPGSKILVTTRSTNIAKMVGNMGGIHLDCLDEESSWAFFRKCAFGSHNSGDHPQLEDIAKKIVPKLKGLPLASRTIGCLLNKKMDEKHWKTIMTSEIWQLPQDDNGVLPVLQLSYQFLPPHLKKCFAFCSLFPKDYYFEEQELIGIWMAEGFIEAQGSERMEDVGANYLHDLVSRSFFQSAQGHRAYVMHDLMHDLAELISAGESYRIDAVKSQEVPNILRHLSVNAREIETRRLTEFPGYNKLWTLSLKYVPTCHINGRYGLFQKLKSIRVLILHNCAIRELPESISNLIHLRYLQISFNSSIQRLPESLCGLYNLQTLILTGCHRLQSLPQGMSKLINLRRLDTTDKMISEIVEVGKLTSLQELPAFKVSKDHGHKLGELSGLTQLHRRLRIMNLENVESREEASNAKLKGKEYLNELELEWAPVTVSNLAKNDLHIFEEVLEGLQPHHTIRYLAIKEYSGARPPSWLNAKALSELENLTIENCKRWEDISLILQLPHVKCLHLKGMPIEKRINHELFGPGSTKCMLFSVLEELVLEDLPLLEELPNLGQIPCLKVLRFARMPAVKRIGHDFYGFADEGKCFPRLEKLSFISMPTLEEWSWPEGKELFPCLCELLIRGCPQLKRLSPGSTKCMLFSVLEELVLEDLPLLEELPNLGQIPCLKVLRIGGMPAVKRIGHDFYGFADEGKCFPRLEELSFRSMPALEEWSWPEGKELFPCLCKLQIEGCPQLKRLSPPPLSLMKLYLSGVGLTELPRLQKVIHGSNNNLLISLQIYDCPNLTNLDQAEWFVSLRDLHIGMCLLLKRVPPIPPSLSSLRLQHVGLAELPLLHEETDGSSRKVAVSLSHLEISFCENLTSLEQGLLSYHLPNLQSISIESCGELLQMPVKRLRELTILNRLVIRDCPKLRHKTEGEYLHLPPSVSNLKLSNCGDLSISLPHCLHNLASLDELDIRLCPNMVALPIRPFVHLRELVLQDCKELISIDGLCVKSLNRLVITGCPKLSLLSEREEQRASSIEHWLEIDDTSLLKLFSLKNALPSIKYLTISDSSQEVMFEGEEQGLLLSLTDLRRLAFTFCKNLQRLPSQLHTLSSLEHLRICGCPHIESLSEKGLPTSLTRLQFFGCHPKLTEELEKQVAEMKSSGRWSIW